MLFSSRAAALGLLVLFACDAEAPSGDAGSGGIDAGSGCRAHAECDDGVFCNGAERCAPTVSTADELGCVAGTSPCGPGTSCEESTLRCVAGCDTDADGDGSLALECGGDDCDDEDPRRFPENPEACDALGHDEDCDPSTVGDRDADGDLSIDDACCNGDRCGNDCDDMAANVSRLATEVCDGVDNDCDGATDEGLLIESWPDDDGDGWGDETATPESGCTLPSGRADRGRDCDDDRPERHPTALEFCNSMDEDCDGETDEGAGFACEIVLPHSRGECIEGQCHVTGCTGTFFDCDEDTSTGCETDLCSDVTACNACGNVCTGIGPTCDDGVCTFSGPTAIGIGVLTDAVTGAPIPGATLTTVGTCNPTTVMTDAGGQWALPYAGGRSWVRIEAAGYPIHVVLTIDSIFPQSVVDAWLADPDLASAPRADRALLVVSHGDGLTVPTTARFGARHAIDGADLLPSEGAGPGGLELLVDVLPGRARVAQTLVDRGCTTRCFHDPEGMFPVGSGSGDALFLVPGAVTVVGPYSCQGVCS